MEKKTTAYLIPHTHWDREWRYPLWKNRMLLVEFMEELLGILDRDPEYHCFLLDGQVAPIEDYLEVAPHDRERVTRHIRDGRIAIGPWYTLPDLYPLDGESLVRNLLVGTRTALKYGDWQKVGYNSFGWGQTAQFPQIYAGFGIDFIICAKKVSEERAPDSEFLWQAPDGTTILTSRLGTHARGNFYYLAHLYSRYGVNCLSSDFAYRPELSGTAIHGAGMERQDEDFFMLEGKSGYEPDRLRRGFDDAWAASEATVAKECRLFLNGSDFSTPHPELSRMMADLRAQNPGIDFINGRLEDYAAALHQVLDKVSLRTIVGELRDGPAGDCSANALASRCYLKQLNKEVQNRLIHQAEPWSVVASCLGADYPAGFLAAAWKQLLESHPHDSINGVTQDKTADDVEHRLMQALEMSQVIQDKAVAEIIKRIDLPEGGAGEAAVLVFNPHPRPIREVIGVNVVTAQAEKVWSLKARDGDGAPLATQELARDEKSYPVHDMGARPWPYFADRHLMLVDSGEIPALGYKLIRFVPTQRFDRSHFYWLTPRKSAGDEICTSDGVLENQYLKAELQPNGTISLTDKESGRVHEGLHYFEDSGDVGNYWAFFPPYQDRVYTTQTARVTSWREANGPLSAMIAVQYDWDLPEGADEPMYGVRGPSRRSERSATVRIISRFTLTKFGRRLDVKTSLTNNIRNHRLRVAFPTGIPSAMAASSGHFTVDERPAVSARDAEGRYWPEMNTLPMQHFVDVSDGHRGLALLNNCLTEYELRDDAASTVYLTLFRAMGNMIVTWWEAVGVFPGHDGSQILRDLEFEYAIFPHAGAWAEGAVWQEADRLNRKPQAYQVTGPSHGSLPLAAGFLEIQPSCLVQSAFKRAEDRSTRILRLFNPTDAVVEATVSLGQALRAAWQVDLNETRLAPVAIQDSRVLRLPVAGNKIVTIELEFAVEAQS
jgi:mannosylglycerate hydrolase